MSELYSDFLHSKSWQSNELCSEMTGGPRVPCHPCNSPTCICFFGGERRHNSLSARPDKTWHLRRQLVPIIRMLSERSRLWLTSLLNASKRALQLILRMCHHTVLTRHNHRASDGSCVAGTGLGGCRWQG